MYLKIGMDDNKDNRAQQNMLWQGPGTMRSLRLAFRVVWEHRAPSQSRIARSQAEQYGDDFILLFILGLNIFKLFDMCFANIYVSASCQCLDPWSWNY